MSDHTDPGGHGFGGVSHALRSAKAEYYLYFAAIFLVALPFAALAWIARLVIDRHLPPQGPLARAIAEADSITPEIFRH